MYLPNSKLTLKLASGKTDVYGQPIPGRTVTEPCCIVSIQNLDKKTSVRADSSASRGAAEELEADAVLLVGPKTQAQLHDIVVVAGTKVKIVKKQGQFDLSGSLDHYELSGMIWVD